ncbi:MULTISPECIES: heme-degrading domain-containing protein [unclassified Serratia (in: enterobacteria)]|uniref:heme-degrading domain-containing protein n=1 Tax=unclassified Serratia (in: enterobacteria) TaxID=2647522 RepID=UPI0024AFFF51|nr:MULTISPECIES: heme-degrading domain-containing protein [unclassified Serratia (in: enterobacteria)]MDI6933696.1 heme-degrading domain-containing protein [Serratia sp. Se-PFBMAAmG]MDI9227626.1 heme-degrading domain-containing protein [Serratia bockelmannii]MDI6946248.1 heme-degrading domain-containing protein [Serratia sp. Se-RSmG]MDI6978191.1 heme-degrading domain-containing protein [Serratia sp. Se-RSBMAAmG]MDI9262540.1 heme-degrading domain-containing protein [Serratia sp. PF2-63]
MNIDDELQALSEQEATLAFTHFDATTAWELGAALKTAAERRGLSIAIEIQLAGQTLFYYAMPGATPDIADWVRRKRNLVNHFHKSSYAIGQRYGLSVRDYSVHGGAFPLTLTGLGCVGSISISGAPQKEDHQLLVSTLAHFLGLSLPALH